jgi:ribosomal protein L4
MPAKMKAKALCGALTLKAKSGQLLALDAYAPKEVKTKIASTALQAMGL